MPITSKGTEQIIFNQTGLIIVPAPYGFQGG